MVQKVSSLYSSCLLIVEFSVQLGNELIKQGTNHTLLICAYKVFGS